MSQPTTSLARIRASGLYPESYAFGLRKYGADTPITVRQIVRVMGLDDALWCLQMMPEHDNLWRLFAVRCARRVQYLMTDPRSVAALDVAERYARGQATADELKVAYTAAGDVDAFCGDVSEAEWASAGAAWDATYPVAAQAAWASAMDTAQAVGSTAWPAERAWQAAELIRICEELGA